MRQPSLFQPSHTDPVTGTVRIGERTYAWTLYPDRLTEMAHRDHAPAPDVLHITFQLDGVERIVRHYDRRDQVWAMVREGVR